MRKLFARRNKNLVISELHGVYYHPKEIEKALAVINILKSKNVRILSTEVALDDTSPSEKSKITETSDRIFEQSSHTYITDCARATHFGALVLREDTDSSLEHKSRAQQISDPTELLAIIPLPFND